MKKLFLILLIQSLFIGNIQAQQYNWSNFTTDNEHLIYASTGLDYGFTNTIGYGYYTKFYIPLTVNANVSIPLGSNFLDDIKLKIGVEAQLFETNNFHFIGKYYLVSKRYETSLTRQYAFGNEIGLTIGYYKPKWYAAGEFNYDRVSISHIKHKDAYLENYPSAKNGWYEQLGGNFQYGIQGGYSFSKVDLNLKLGMSTKQTFDNNTIPYYGVLGANFHLNAFNKK